MPQASGEPPDQKQIVGDCHRTPATRFARRRYQGEGDCFDITTAPMLKLERMSSTIRGMKGVSGARKSDLVESGNDRAAGDLWPSSGEESTSYEGGATVKGL